jgi:type IV secretion system protein VirD4
VPVIRPHALRGILLLACGCVGFGLARIGMHVPFIVLLIAVGVVWNRFRRVTRAGWAYGTATLANMGQLIRWKMLGHDGLILGTTGIMPRPSFWEGLCGLWSARNPADIACYLFLYALGGSKWVGDRMIRLHAFTHLATFAPTGRGKGVSVLIPNLLSYRHSCVVTDPKGELHQLTSEHRRRKFNHDIIRLDPFGICGPGSGKFNPLDFIDDKADDFLDQCRNLADMLIVRTGREPDPHWNDSARIVLTAFIAYVCACETNPQERNLNTVRDLLSSRHSYAKAIEIMQQVESHYGVIQRQGHSLTWFVEKELGSVQTSVLRYTEFLDGPLVQRHTATSSFHPRRLRKGDRATIYLCLPPDKLESLAPLMRMWVGSLLKILTQGPPSEKNPVLFLLDECAHLGKIRVLEQAVTLMRGMGIRLWFFFQSVHQLTDCFGENAKTFLDNIDTQQYFSINEYENAQAISKRIGDTTVSVTTYGKNRGSSSNRDESGKRSSGESDGWNTNVSETGRRLIKAEELIVMPEDVALIFHRNLPVIPARLLRHYDHPSFRGGGTGHQPGLGSKATEKALCLLLLCIAFAVFAVLETSPSTPDRFRPRQGRQDSGFQWPGFGSGSHSSEWDAFMSFEE